MEMLVYFAAHAPEEIPDWFEAVFDEPRPESPQLKWTVEQRKTWRETEGGEFMETTDPRWPAMQALVVEFNKFRQAETDWNHRKKLYTYFTWRWAYARLMCDHAPILKP